jgi:hypothetical protein
MFAVILTHLSRSRCLFRKYLKLADNCFASLLNEVNSDGVDDDVHNKIRRPVSSIECRGSVRKRRFYQIIYKIYLQKLHTTHL